MGSFRGTILMLRSKKTKHQHSAKHKNAGERVFEGIREAIWLGRVTSRGLQHGCFPADLQAKHLSRHPILRIAS